MKALSKAFTLLLAAITVCSMLSFSSFAATEDLEDFDVWDGSADTSWFEEGTKEYDIDTAEKLAGIAKLTDDGNTLEGYTFYVTKNMDLNNLEWLPIGPTQPLTFSGTLLGKLNGQEGASVTVKNMKINRTKESKHAAPNVGFIGTQSAGVFKYFNFVNANVYSEFATTGIAVGYIRSKATACENIVVVDSSVSTAPGVTEWAGGVVAYVKPNEGIHCTFRNLAFINGSVDCQGAKHTGGVIGCLQRVSGEFENLYASGVIYSDGQGVGGLVGSLLSEKGAVERSFKNCQFDGVVYSDFQAETGAMVGYVEEAAKLTFENCVNTGVSRASCLESIERSFSWIGSLFSTGEIEFTATNCYDNSHASYLIGENFSDDKDCSNYKPTALTFEQMSGAVNAMINMTGLDFVDTWEPREGMTPVLAIAKDYGASKYAAADLSWFDADVTKEYAIENDNQLLGLAMLSYACSPTEYTFKVADSLKDKMTEELFSEYFLDKFNGEEEVTTAAPETSEGPHNTTVEPDNTTVEPDNTTVEPDGTTAEPDVTTKPTTPAGTTAPADDGESAEDGCAGCGGFSVAASFLALICAAGAAIVIKKR
ncbi:MAG: hypothetical protein IJX46_05810 [Clostridia bacterium]|nr:hypothetical protein [Clostridia bacterium]